MISLKECRVSFEKRDMGVSKLKRVWTERMFENLTDQGKS